MTEFAAAMKDDDWWAGFDEPAAIKRASVALARGDNPAVDYGYEEATGAFQTQHSDDEEEEPQVKEPQVKEPDWQEQQKSKLQTIISRRRGSVAGSLASGNSGGSGGSGNGTGTTTGVSGARSGSPIPTRSNHSAGSRRSSCAGSSGEPLVRRERSRGGHKERPPHQSTSASSSGKTRPSRSRSNSGDDPIISREEPHSSSSRVDPRRASRSKSRSRSLGRRQSLAAVSTTRCASPTPPPPSSKSPTATTRRPTVRRAKTMDDDSLQELAQLAAAAAPPSSSRRENSPPPPPSSCARGTTNMATNTANHRRMKMRRSMSIGHITTPSSEPQPPRSPPRSDERRSMMKRKNSLKNLGALAGGGSGSFRRTHATPGTPVVGDEISIDETAQALFLDDDDDDDDSQSSHDQDPATTPSAKTAVPNRRSMDTATHKSRRDTLRKSVSDRRNKPKQTQHQHALDSKNKSHSLSKLQKFKDLGQQHYQLRHKMVGTDHSNNAHAVDNDDYDNSHDNDNSYSHDDESDTESENSSDTESEGSLCEQHLVHPLRKHPSHNRNHNSKTRVGIGSLANNLSANNNNNNSATNNSKNFLLDGSLDLQQAITVVNNNTNNSGLNITEKAQKLKELSDSYKKTTSQLMQRGTVKK